MRVPGRIVNSLNNFELSFCQLFQCLSQSITLHVFIKSINFDTQLLPPFSRVISFWRKFALAFFRAKCPTFEIVRPSFSAICRNHLAVFLSVLIVMFSLRGSVIISFSFRDVESLRLATQGPFEPFRFGLCRLN